MNRFLPILLAVLVVAGTLTAFFVLKKPGDGLFGNLTVPTAITASSPYLGAPLAKEYKNDALRFSVMMPDAFRAQQIQEGEDGATTIVLQNDSGDGIQVIVTPFPDDTRELTAAQVQQDIPDLTITDVEPIEIGPLYKGIAFKSDNEAFGGASREVWFVFHSALYQISTYQRLDPLLQAMFATWKFY